MSAGDRIQRFFDDQVKLIPLVMTPQFGKVVSEIGHIKSWLFKHQSEALSEGLKGKLLQILEKYNRAAITANAVRNAVIALFQDYLALPEGKLTSSKNKTTVLGWLGHLNTEEERDSNAATMQAKLTTEQWEVASIEHDLLCLVNGDKIRENIRVDNLELLELIKMHYGGEGGFCYVMVSIDPNASQDTFEIIDVCSE
jgi:hypothetical protein